MDRLARLLSVVFHPLVSLTAWALLVALLHRGWLGADAQIWSLLVLVPGLVLVGGARIGIWSDLDVSNLRERRTFLPVAALLSVALAVWSTYAPFPHPLVVATVAVALWLCATAAISQVWKISMHTGATTGLVAVVAVVLGPRWILALGWAPFAVAWARLRLDRHTPAQVAAGGLVALSAVALTLLLVGP